MKRHPILRASIPVALILLSACGAEADRDALAAVAVGEALCRPTPKGRDATGCYVILTASRDDRLVGVSSPLAGEGQVHEMKVQDGIMSMAELKDGLALPAGEAITLRPGGNHIMLIGLTQPLVAGQTVPLTLDFGTAASVEVQARVAQPGPASANNHH